MLDPESFSADFVNRNIAFHREAFDRVSGRERIYSIRAIVNVIGTFALVNHYPTTTPSGMARTLDELKDEDSVASIEHMLADKNAKYLLRGGRRIVTATMEAIQDRRVAEERKQLRGGQNH